MNDFPRTFPDVQPGAGAVFGGTRRLDCGHSASLHNPAPVTMIFEVCPATTTLAYQTIFDKGWQGGYSPRFWLSLRQNILYFQINTSTSNYYVTYTMESPSVYLVAPSDYQQLYFSGVDHSDDIDWTNNGCSTYNARLHAISYIYLSSIDIMAPSGLTVVQASNP